MTTESPPADREPTSAGTDKVRNFADRVRLGLQIDKARQIQEDLRALQDEAARLSSQLGDVSVRLSALMAGLERERNGGREPAAS
jgi:hypothetical protein